MAAIALGAVDRCTCMGISVALWGAEPGRDAARRCESLVSSADVWALELTCGPDVSDFAVHRCPK